MKRRSFFGALASLVLSPMAMAKETSSGPRAQEKKLADTLYGYMLEKQPYRGPVRIDYLTADTYDKLGVVIGGGHGRPIRVCT